MKASSALLDWLAAEEAAVRAAVPAYRSLAPGRDAPTPWQELASRLVAALPVPHQRAWGEALVTIQRAQAAAFPETLFWDVDLLAASLLREAPTPDALAAHARAIASVHACFARHGAIAFRYAHDFTYGFDWARWVAKEPATRAGHGPFSPAFVARMARRGEELHALIAADDATYPRLAAGAPRNPFGFSREPADEARLLEAMAAAGEIPVAGWRHDVVATWDAPFAALREARARALGLAAVGP